MALLVPTSQRPWLAIFNEFITHLRIDSKETLSTGKHGSSLVSWGSQRMFLENVCEGLDRGVRTFYCLKSRQLGVSTISLAIDIFWLAMHPGLQGALVIDTDENREKFRLVIHRYIESFPKGFFGQSFSIVKGKDNKTFTHFSNGSTLDYLVAGKRKKATLGESRAYNFLHSSETANYGDPSGIASLQKTLAQTHPNRLYLYESTGKGFNHWHDMYFEAKRDELTKKAFFLGWWSKEINSYSLKGPAPEPALYREYGAEPPNREEQELIDKVLERHGVAITRGQLAWYRHECSDTSTSDEDQHQNIPWVEEQAFVLTGYSFFQTRVLQLDMARIQGLDEGSEPVQFKAYRFWVGNDFFSSKMEQVFRVEDAELRIWEEPSKHGDYVIGCDPAYGRSDEGDNTSISVWRCYADKLVQVAEYTMNKIDTRQAAWILAYLAGSYRNCIVNLELTGGVGMAVMTEFKNLRDQLQSPAHFQKVKDLEWEDFLNNARWFLYHRPDSLGAGYVNGFMTTRDRKFEIMNQLRDLHVTGTLVVNSLPLTQEMLCIVQDGGHLGAQGTNKDDRVFAAALAARSYIDWVRPKMLAANMTYDRVLAGEEGTQEGDPGVVDRMVADFFRRAEEREAAGPEHPKWLQDRGLV